MIPGFLRGLAVAAMLCAGAPALAIDDRVVVMTSYPDEMATLFESAFERAHPGTDVQILWKHARDAADLLRAPGAGGVDVYWTPAAGSFPALRDAGVFRPLPVDRAALPGRIGGQAISDPQGRYEAFEVAGYGIAVNPAVLARLGLPVPARWADLARPVYAGQVILPIASQVGFSPALYDILLQAEGWERGWALLSEIAGNARLVGSGGGVTEAVAEGAAAAPTIDFFVRSAIANGRPVALVYPPRTAFLPAHVAITAAAPHPDAARAFVDFVLGRVGQALLFHPDVRRYPVRPEVYASAPAGMVNPFAGARDDGFTYDPALGTDRAGLIAALFDRMVTERHERLTALWAAIHKAEAALARHPDPAAAALAGRARALASAVPVDAAAAVGSELPRLFRGNPSAKAPDGATALAEAWSARLDRAQEDARAFAEQALASLPADR